MVKITIEYYRGGTWVWAGDGEFDGGSVVSTADLGEEAYSLLDLDIEEALAEERREGEIETEDGHKYSWAIIQDR